MGGDNYLREMVETFLYRTTGHYVIIRYFIYIYKERVILYNWMDGGGIARVGEVDDEDMDTNSIRFQLNGFVTGAAAPPQHIILLFAAWIYFQNTNKQKVNIKLV